MLCQQSSKSCERVPLAEKEERARDEIRTQDSLTVVMTDANRCASTLEESGSGEGSVVHYEQVVTRDY